MEANITMQEIAGWLGQVRTPAVSVGMIGEKSVNLMVGGALEMTVEAAGNGLTVAGEQALPQELQAVLDTSRLEEVALGAARSSAVPMSATVRQVGAEARIAFSTPLFVEGLTRNELASAVWAVWNAHDRLVRQIRGVEQIEAISAEMKALQGVMDEAAGAPEAVAAVEGQLPAETPAIPPVEEQSALAAVESAPSSEAAVEFCPQCGNKVRSGARFCNKCGTSLAE